MKLNENIVLCGYSVHFLLILDNFCINRKLNFKKVSLYKPTRVFTKQERVVVRRHQDAGLSDLWLKFAISALRWKKDPAKRPFYSHHFLDSDRHR